VTSEGGSRVKRHRELVAEAARERMQRIGKLEVAEHDVEGKRQLYAAIALAAEMPCVIRLHRAGGAVTVYRFPWGLSEGRVLEVRERIAKTPAAAFR
jgi:hypothetical protein